MGAFSVSVTLHNQSNYEEIWEKVGKSKSSFSCIEQMYFSQVNAA